MKKVLLIVGVIAVLGLAVSAPDAMAKKKTPALEAYSGHTVNINLGVTPRRGSTFVELEVQRWTTEEEGQAYGRALANGGSEGLVDELRDGDKAGWVRLPGTTSYNLKYAREIETAEGRQLIFATDRPVAMRELRTSARSMDYGVTLIQFTMPKNGSAGSGTILVGAELKIEDDGTLSVENAAMNPVHFEGIKLKEKKEKK